MTNLFSYDGLIYKTGTKIFQLLVLNILYLVTCLPLITIGSANTALAAATMKMIEGKEGNVAIDYLHAFISNFKMATYFNVLFGMINVLVLLNYLFAGAVSSSLRPFVYFALGLAGVISLVGMTFIYPYIARFDDDIVTTTKNTSLLILKHGKLSFLILLVAIVPVLLAILSPLLMVFSIYISAFIGFALLTYLKSLLLLSIYKQY
ncbi:YesL family protein [Pseudolactococcus carnosus]|uniref:YesL family protein n=1 Tax=Pseudolactococcus carnosus TaxID=2749961 RepID=UPI001FB9E2D3|nr:YesL family protein [Lactococcus carnosus]MCJ1973561.1 YesL family protein [Lactococcus carnosus]